MAASLMLARALPVTLARPAAFAGRCAIASVEILLAMAILVGAVAVGHDLREWRAWYDDPATSHPWAPTHAPSTPRVAAPALPWR